MRPRRCARTCEHTTAPLTAADDGPTGTREVAGGRDAGHSGLSLRRDESRSPRQPRHVCGTCASRRTADAPLGGLLNLVLNPRGAGRLR